MKVLWGTSFDAVATSGVIVEFLKTARLLRDRGYEIRLDLGYEIRTDKGSFGRPYDGERLLLPDWVTLDRIEGVTELPGYGPALVAQVLREVVQNGRPGGSEVDLMVDRLAELILDTWERVGVGLVIVENGTLPENVVYTRALYRAIDEYGARHRLGTFVLWRDHDLMWQSEPGTGKYGTPPYPAAVPPSDSPYIHYAALHEQALEATRRWVPELTRISVLRNVFAVPDQDPARSGGPDLRARLGIPAGAPVIARCTRIIRQKRIDRDIHLVAALADRCDAYLVVCGSTVEEPATTAALVDLADRLGVASRVIFCGPLAPIAAGRGRSFPSVADLLATATVASFLTSFDYESFGNPIGEAITAGVPYVTSRYALYDEVYGRFGYRAPVLPITESDLPTPAFVDEVARLLSDDGHRTEIAAHNQRIARRTSTGEEAENMIDDIFSTPMGAATRMSVVLPVFNEAATLRNVLTSLYEQQDQDGGLLDRALYEIVVVDNNSTDDTVEIVREFAHEHPDLPVHVLHEPEQGVSCARRRGMQFAARRSRRRDDGDARFYLVSADADCEVDRRWLGELFIALEHSKAAIGVCDYYYEPSDFVGRPRLWEMVDRTLRCRAVTFPIFGGFPDGKGFAVTRDAYDKVGGIEILYQLRDGRFVNHLSDDWDFGIKVRAAGEEIVYVPTSRVRINPRRIDHALDEVVQGQAYGSKGTIVMRDIRPETPGSGSEDLDPVRAQRAWEYSIKDFTPKNTILPVLLTPSLLDDQRVREFFGASLADRLRNRIAEIMHEMRMVDLTPIHAYKTPSYRLYLEFADEIFARLRETVGPDIGEPPPLPECFADVPPERFTEFVRYYCEDRESGEAHDYFGNGGVF